MVSLDLFGNEKIWNTKKICLKRKCLIINKDLCTWGKIQLKVPSFGIILKICSDTEVINSCHGGSLHRVLRWHEFREFPLKNSGGLQTWPTCFVLRCCWRCAGFMPLLVNFSPQKTRDALGGLQLMDANPIKTYTSEYCCNFDSFGFTFLTLVPLCFQQHSCYASTTTPLFKFSRWQWLTGDGMWHMPGWVKPSWYGETGNFAIRILHSRLNARLRLWA